MPHIIVFTIGGVTVPRRQSRIRIQYTLSALYAFRSPTRHRECPADTHPTYVHASRLLFSARHCYASVSEAFKNDVRISVRLRNTRGRYILFQTFLEFTFLSRPLLFFPPIPLGVKAFLSAPLFPCDFFDLEPQVQHHVTIRLCMRVGFK